MNAWLLLPLHFQFHLPGRWCLFWLTEWTAVLRTHLLQWGSRCAGKCTTWLPLVAFVQVVELMTLGTTLSICWTLSRLVECTTSRTLCSPCTSSILPVEPGFCPSYHRLAHCCYLFRSFPFPSVYFRNHLLANWLLCCPLLQVCQRSCINLYCDCGVVRWQINTCKAYTKFQSNAFKFVEKGFSHRWSSLTPAVIEVL